LNSSSKSRFVDSALLSGLVTPGQIERAQAEVRQRDATLAAHDAALAQQLVDAGVLTPYQALQLKAGRTRLTLGP
jgi:hypothetical protein